MAKYLIAGSVLFFTEIGCSYTIRDPAIHIEPKGYYNKADQYGDWANVNRERLATYIGKDKQDVLSGFGKPSYVETNSILHGGTYEEEWIYYYTRGIPFINQNSWTLNFYFDNGVVAEVDVI